MLGFTGKGKGRNEKSNHRLYDNAALEKMWQILLYREMGFELTEIKHILTLSKAKRQTYLKQRIEVIIQQMLQLDEQIKIISTVQNYGIPPTPSKSNGDCMTYLDYISVLKKEWLKKYSLTEIL